MKNEKKDKHFIKKPIFPGGRKAMLDFLKHHLSYPEQALIQGVEGTVVLRYAIDFKGNVTDTQVITSLGHGCDEEAQRVVRLMKFDVPPSRGLRVTFHNTIKVHFQAPKAIMHPSPPPTAFQYVYTQNTPDKKPEDAQVSYAYTITIG